MKKENDITIMELIFNSEEKIMKPLIVADYLGKLTSRKAEKGIHSYNHQIVKEVCDYFVKIKEFGLWLGVAKRIGAG